MNQNNCVCLLGLLLILILLCKQQNKSILELFGISSLSSGQVFGGNSGNISTDNEIIFVYADWCGHCNAFKPEWSKFEEWANENGVKSKKVEGDKEQALCEKHQIQGFPTILKLNSNGDKVSEYMGERNSNGLIQFASS